MQNIAFIPFLLNNTSGFIHPLNWPSSALSRPICLSWITFVSPDWEPSKVDGLIPLHYQNNPVLSAMHNSFKHPNSLCDSDHQRHEP